MAEPRAVSRVRAEEKVTHAIKQFGRSVKSKLMSNDGSTEDHLRAPIERMLEAIGLSLGLQVNAIGETRLPALAVRPDYAINVNGARVGYIELKKPGRGVPPTWPSPNKHDKDQWQKLLLLPNVLYTDGQQWAVFQGGDPDGRAASLYPDLRNAGVRLSATDSRFQLVLTDFLLWKPDRPQTISQLIRSISRLCQLLRDDVAEEIQRELSGKSQTKTFTGLAEEWRGLLFPRLTDKLFADAYAQTVTFALLLARVEGIDFDNRSVSEIARLLGKKHSLMGKALDVLTQQDDNAQSIVIGTMLRVFDAVHWEDFPAESYAALYEQFLAEYDPELRKASGVYYTPQPVVSFMSRFVDDILRAKLQRRLGLAAEDVIVVDPAMGTGSYLAEVIDVVAQTAGRDEGSGSVPPTLRQLSKRLIGFEKQVAPYAVAELRIHAKLRAKHRAEPPAEERRFLADTLDDPNIQALPLGRVYDAIMKSRRGANQVKQSEPVMVVLGNPPYKDKVGRNLAPWVQLRGPDRRSRPNIDAFRAVGNGRWEYVLSNLSVFFWRWATWKVFDAHAGHPQGIVALVTTSAYCSGVGFAGMREYLRRTADEGWIIDLSPEGYRPPVGTRVFRSTRHALCIGVFIRCGAPDLETPAVVHYTSVAGTGMEKLMNLSSLREAYSELRSEFVEV